MGQKAPAKLLVLALAVVCAGAVGGIAWYRNRPIAVGEQIQHLPLRNAVLLHIDFAALRKAGLLQLLAATKATEDVDYQRFIADTGFDYQQDLDSATVSFAPNGNFMLVAGRFEWRKLRAYAQGHGGDCYVATCRMAASKPDRHISFLPLQSNLMAIAVSQDSNAASGIAGKHEVSPREYPKEPIWIALAGSTLKAAGELPAGTRIFARSLEEAENITLALASENGRLAATLQVQCRSAVEASQMAADLQRMTKLLHDMIERENQKPNPADFSGVLTAGSFRAQGAEVFGSWPIERGFLENILNSAPEPRP